MTFPGGEHHLIVMLVFPYGSKYGNGGNAGLPLVADVPKPFLLDLIHIENYVQA